MALSALIVTDASGLVGRSFLAAVQDRHRIYATARRDLEEIVDEVNAFYRPVAPTLADAGKEGVR